MSFADKRIIKNMFLYNNRSKKYSAFRETQFYFSLTFDFSKKEPRYICNFSAACAASSTCVSATGTHCYLQVKE